MRHMSASPEIVRYARFQTEAKDPKLENKEEDPVVVHTPNDLKNVNRRE